MSEVEPNDRLSDEMAKELVDMIADVEREEADAMDQTETARAAEAEGEGPS